MQRLLERLAKHTEQAEVFTIRGESVQIGFEANELKSAQVEETRGIALRAIVDGRLGFAASSDLTAQERLLTNLLDSARCGDEIPLRFPGPSQGPAVDTYSEELAELSIPQLIERGRETIEIIRETDPDVHVRLEIERGVTHISLANSAGARITMDKSSLSISAMVERVRGDDVLIISDFFGTTRPIDGHLDLAANLARRLRLAQRNARLASGRMPVLFAPPSVLVLAMPLMQALNGKNVLHGVSPLAGRMGEKVFDDRFTVTDDATLSGRLSSGSHDYEGMPRRRITLVDHGIVSSFLYDLKTAAQAGAESTGSGVRGLFSPPSPGASNLIIQAGSIPLDELLRDIKTGLFVDTPLGLGQGNPISGAFAHTLGLAYAIRDGEIIGRVKDVSIAGNIYEVLQEVQISHEGRWVYGSVWAPHILVPSLNVTTKG